MNNKMPLYILMLKSSIIWCRQQISQRGKNLEDSRKHTWIHSSLLTVTLVNFSQKYHAFDASFNAIPQLLFRVQDFTGSLYIWKISKFIFLDRKICMRIYFNKSVPPSSKQLDVQFFYYLISSHLIVFSVLQSSRLILKDGNKAIVYEFVQCYTF